jgi:DNA-binding CsgD family transcriptional regulator
VILPDNRERVFPYNQNNLTIHFAAPFFERSPLFSWRLDGLSDNWSPMQPNPEKEFINLPPGQYRFRVRSNIGGDEASVAFRIATPWYRSWWAFGLLTVLFLSVFALIERFSQMRLVRQQARLEEDKQMELNRQRLSAEREKLTLEVDTKSRELSNAALNLIRKNEALQHLRNELLNAGNDTKALGKMARMIDAHLEGDHDWEVFQESFNQVHDDFFKRLMQDYADLTPGDLRLAAYLKMNLSSKEIAPLLNISIRGVENKRYRLRKKIGLPEDANLTEFIMGF